MMFGFYTVSSCTALTCISTSIRIGVIRCRSCETPLTTPGSGDFLFMIYQEFAQRRWTRTRRYCSGAVGGVVPSQIELFVIPRSHVRATSRTTDVIPTHPAPLVGTIELSVRVIFFGFGPPQPSISAFPHTPRGLCDPLGLTGVPKLACLVLCYLSESRAGQE